MADELASTILHEAAHYCEVGWTPPYALGVTDALPGVCNAYEIENKCKKK